jgi:CDP-paratose 2-epimerase
MKPEHLIKCTVQRNGYKVFGYRGKQVRDNTHFEGVARFLLEFARAPRVAEVYNLRGGRQNFCWILEASEIAGEIRCPRRTFEEIAASQLERATGKTA